MLSEIQIIEKSIEILGQEPSIKRNYEQDIERLKERLEFAKEKSYRMGVIGVTSSGKSTLLNALLGESLLPMDTCPTSSQLVSCGYSAKREAVVYFSDDKSKTLTGRELTIDAISLYADEKKNPGNEKKVRQVYLSSPKMELPSELKLIDSPGLDAYGFPQHDKLTLNVLLPTIDFCIFITTFKTNSDKSMKIFLSEIAKYNKPAIIVINMYDAVRPSPDNKKSKEQVANDTRTRVQRVINNSGFPQPQAIPILFFSAKPILIEREQNGKTDNVLYSGFLQMIKKMLEAVRQQMDANRFSTLRRELQDIVIRMKAECKGADNALRFSLDKARTLAAKKTEINNRYQGVITSAKEQIQELERIYKSVESLSECDKTTLDEKIQEVNRYCDNLVNAFRQFNPLIEDYCKEFNLNSSDYRVRICEPAPLSQLAMQKKDEIYYEPEWRDKSGVGAKIARGFGKLFGKDTWGKEEIQVEKKRTVTDPFATKIELEKKVRDRYTECNRLYQEWYRSIESQYQNVSDVADRIITDTRKGPVESVSPDIIRRIQNQMEQLIIKIPDRLIPVTNMITSPPNPANPTAFGLSSELEALFRMSNEIMRKIRLDVFRKSRLTTSPADQTSIVSWDLNSVIQFLYHSFGIQMSDSQVNQLEKMRYLRTDRIELFYQPSHTETEKYFTSSAEQISSKNAVHDYYILVNTVQSGQAESDIFGSEILSYLPNNAHAYFVVQNGVELFGSGHTLEGIRFMRSIQQKAKNAGYIMIEHENPIYQICLSEVQKYSIVHQREEIEILSALEKLDYLYRPEMLQTLAAILRAFSDTK